MEKLQACQNIALKTATEKLLMSPEHHLLSDASRLRANKYNASLYKQFQLVCYWGTP